MMHKIIITNSAFSDLECIKLFVAKDNLEIAKRHIHKIFDRFEQLETFPYGGLKIANSSFGYAKAYYLMCANHVAIYQVDELAKCVYILRILSHYQDFLGCHFISVYPQKKYAFTEADLFHLPVC
jgi:plasmid stabilization system protein ParE